MDAVFNETVNIVEIDEGFDHYTLVVCVCVHPLVLLNWILAARKNCYLAHCLVQLIFSYVNTFE